MFGSFSETLRPHKSLHTCQWSLFWIKKKLCPPHVFSNKKKISPKTFGPHCVYYFFFALSEFLHLSYCYRFIWRWVNM
jgi:hypothetical protein